MSRYKTVNVSISLDCEDPLYDRLVAEAERQGKSVEDVVGMLIFVGSDKLLRDRLDALDRMREMREGYRVNEEIENE